MRIKILRNCNVRRSFLRYCGDGCCSWFEWVDWFLVPGEEVDLNDTSEETDISGLKYKEDYEIIEYP